VEMKNLRRGEEISITSLGPKNSVNSSSSAKGYRVDPCMLNGREEKGRQNTTDKVQNSKRWQDVGRTRERFRKNCTTADPGGNKGGGIHIEKRKRKGSN